MDDHTDTNPDNPGHWLYHSYVNAYGHPVYDAIWIPDSYADPVVRKLLPDDVQLQPAEARVSCLCLESDLED